MSVRFRCTGCNAILSVASRKEGTSVRCPRCQASLVIPNAADDGAADEPKSENLGGPVEKDWTTEPPPEVKRPLPRAVPVSAPRPSPEPDDWDDEPNEPERPPRQPTQRRSRPIITPLHTVRGVQDLLEVYDTKLTITPKGVLGFLNKGLKGTKEIPFASITAMQLKKAGLTRGYIQFTVPGGNESRGGIFSAVRDENTFMFVREHNDLMAEIKDFIERRTAELRAPQSRPSPASLSDELQKFAHLHAQGILSAEEFQAAKNRLISQ